MYRHLVEFRTRKAHRWVVRDLDLLRYLCAMIVAVLCKILFIGLQFIVKGALVHTCIIKQILFCVWPPLETCPKTIKTSRLLSCIHCSVHGLFRLWRVSVEGWTFRWKCDGKYVQTTKMGLRELIYIVDGRNDNIYPSSGYTSWRNVSVDLWASTSFCQQKCHHAVQGEFYITDLCICISINSIHYHDG